MVDDKNPAPFLNYTRHGEKHLKKKKKKQRENLSKADKVSND